MEWIIENWQWLALGIMVLDKIVAATPTPYDDIILTAIKGAFNTVKPKK